MTVQPPPPPPPPDGTQRSYIARILYNPELTSEMKEELLKAWIPEDEE